MTDPARIAAIEEDNLNLFAYTFELKKQCAALMQERDTALSALDAALELHADVEALKGAEQRGYIAEICVRSPLGDRWFSTQHEAAAWVRSQQEGRPS